MKFNPLFSSTGARYLGLGVCVMLFLLILREFVVDGHILIRDVLATVSVDSRPVPNARLFRDIHGNLFLPLDTPPISRKGFALSNLHFPQEGWVYLIDRRKSRVLQGSSQDYAEVGNFLIRYRLDQGGMVLGSAKSESEPNLVRSVGSVAFSTQDHKRVTIQPRLNGG
jgi:hypothetical protein